MVLSKIAHLQQLSEKLVHQNFVFLHEDNGILVIPFVR